MTGLNILRDTGRGSGCKIKELCVMSTFEQSLRPNILKLMVLQADIRAVQIVPMFDNEGAKPT